VFAYPSIASVDDHNASRLATVTMVCQRRPDRSGRVDFVVHAPTLIVAKLELFDILGRHVRTLWDGRLGIGTTKIGWDGLSGSGATPRSGMYFARLQWPGGQRKAKVLLLH